MKNEIEISELTYFIMDYQLEIMAILPIIVAILYGIHIGITSREENKKINNIHRKITNQK